MGTQRAQVGATWDTTFDRIMSEITQVRVMFSRLMETVEIDDEGSASLRRRLRLDIRVLAQEGSSK